MKRSEQRKLKIGGVTLALVFVILIGYTYVDDNVKKFDAEKSFTLPSLDLYGQNANNINPEIFCKLKHVGTAVDNAGNTTQTWHSQLLQGNPIFDLTDTTGKPLAGYNIQVRVWCDINTSLGIEIKPSTIVLVVHSKNPDTSNRLTLVKQLTTSALTFNSGDSEKILANFGVNAKTIEDKMPTTPLIYDSLQHFEIAGTLKVSYIGYPNPEFKIPIKQGDIESWINAKIINDPVAIIQDEVDPEKLDTDGDGIIDKFDQCDTQRETFNGYQDSDGCPDTAPVVTPPPVIISTPPTVTDKQMCLNENKTWYISSGSEYCGTRIGYSTGTCDVYHVESRECLEGQAKGTPYPTPNQTTKSSCIADGFKTWYQTSTSDAGSCGELKVIDPPDVVCGVWYTDTNQCEGLDVTNNISAKIAFQVDISLADSTNLAFHIEDDPSPYEFFIPLSLFSSSTENPDKRLAFIKVEPRIIIADNAVHKSTTTQASNITIEPIITVRDVEYSLGKMSQQNFIKTNGGGIQPNTIGLPLGSITIKAQDVENKIPLSVIPLGSSAPTKLKFIIDGDISLIYNDNGIIKNFNDIDITGADFEFIGMNIIRASGDSAPDPNPDPNCDPNTENVVTIAGVTSCIPKGKTTEDDKNDLPKIGETGVEICTDNVFGIGGFPCTEDYRTAYCSGTNDCSVPSGDDGSGSDINVPEITPIIDPIVTCPEDTLQSLSLNTDGCVVVDGIIATGGNQGVVIGGGAGLQGIQGIGGNEDTNTILLIGAGLALVGFVAFILKRRR